MIKTPVFIFHLGNPEYLEQVICQAQKNNEVHLLGDLSNKDICPIWDEAEKYIPADYYEFEKVFEQMSDYSLDFDLNCFKRFFIMREYMKKNNLSQMVFLDSDVLLYINMSEYYDKYKCNTALSIPERQSDFRWTAQAHCSFWTLEYLSDFIDFTMETYSGDKEKLREKYGHHVKNSIKGGVCDMTLLYLWSLTKDGIYNTCKITDDAVFDHCLGSAGNYYDNEYKYIKSLQSKKIVFKQDQPYLLTKSGKQIKANALHCQGAAKALIPFILNFKFRTFPTYMARYTEIAKRLLKK